MSRRRQNTPLGWFLVISLLLNHAVVLPVAFHLLTSDRSDSTREPETLEVELVDPPARPEPVQPDERRQPSSALQRKVARLTPRKKKPRRPRQPPEKKRTEKKKKKKKKKELVEPPPPPEAMRLKMVEVNNPESEKPPPNARFLSDKNRRVKRETRARHTNLVKDHPRPRPMSLPSPMRHTRPGSKQKKVAETRQQKAQKVHPLLAMRPRPSKKRKEEVKPLTESAMDGTLPRPQKAQRGRPRLNLDHHSHDRIYGKEARRQRELARLAPSKSRGRGSRWKQIKSALENFIPEVQPGNQTALGTRANPFAVYIARMHRRIHRLWGYGLLVDLDLKSDSNPMNDMKLWSMIEVVVLPDGKVEKATIVKHSGYLPYDVAALNTIFTSSPYQATPRAIRSADGKVYMHWRFHRDQRQCGTFGVDPYILTKPPAGPVDGDMTEVGRRGGTGTRKVRRLNRRRGGVSRGHTASRPAQGTQSASQQKAVRRAALEAAQRLVSPKDPGARRVAAALLRGFEKGDARAMVRACGLPFLSQGRKVATSRDDLARQFKDLIAENRQRKTSGLKLMTVMAARSELNSLPPGAAHGEQMLVGQVKLGRVPVTLILQRRSGKWQVVGLNR